jgi:hypothetical protein
VAFNAEEDVVSRWDNPGRARRREFYDSKVVIGVLLDRRRRTEQTNASWETKRTRDLTRGVGVVRREAG